MDLRRNKDTLECEVDPIEKILTHCIQNWLDYVGKTWDTQFSSWVQTHCKMEPGTTFKEATRGVLSRSQSWVCCHSLVWIWAWLFFLFQSLQVNASIVPPLGHDCFHPNLFQFIIHQIPNLLSNWYRGLFPRG
jgi:hypothetical protein